MEGKGGRLKQKKWESLYEIFYGEEKVGRKGFKAD